MISTLSRRNAQNEERMLHGRSVMKLEKASHVFILYVQPSRTSHWLFFQNRSRNWPSESFWPSARLHPPNWSSPPRLPPQSILNSAVGGVCLKCKRIVSSSTQKPPMASISLRVEAKIRKMPKTLSTHHFCPMPSTTSLPSYPLESLTFLLIGTSCLRGFAPAICSAGGSSSSPRSSPDTHLPQAFA